MVRILAVLVFAVSACSLPFATPEPDLPANLTPPKIVHDIDIDEESVCDFGYCGENRIAAAAGIDDARYRALTVAPIGRAAAEELADLLASTFDGAKRPRIVFDEQPCGLDEEACTSGEYDGDTIYLYDPTVGTLLHELGHHLQLVSPYSSYDRANEDWRGHSDGFEWALRDVYLAYLDADIDHEALELPPLPKAPEYVVDDCVAGDTFAVVSCDGTHYGVVVEVLQLADLDWPGDDAITRKADRACQVAVLDVSPAARFDWLVPTESGWMQGDRSIVCLFVP